MDIHDRVFDWFKSNYTGVSGTCATVGACAKALKETQKWVVMILEDLEANGRIVCINTGVQVGNGYANLSKREWTVELHHADLPDEVLKRLGFATKSELKCALDWVDSMKRSMAGSPNFVANPAEAAAITLARVLRTQDGWQEPAE